MGAPDRPHLRQSASPIAAPLIAVVGSDGAGKSTMCTALLAWLRESRETEICHLGKQTGNIGRALARWPVVGAQARRKIDDRSGRVRAGGELDAFTALLMYLLSMRRVRRFRRMLEIRRRGITILADRYPQIVVPGRMDGPALAFATPKSRLVQMLCRRERALYEWMTSIPPDIVIRLNVDLDTAVARKPDHRRSALKAKIEAVPRLSFNGAPIIDLDATRPLAEVLDHAKDALGAMLAAHGESRADAPDARYQASDDAAKRRRMQASALTSSAANVVPTGSIKTTARSSSSGRIWLGQSS